MQVALLVSVPKADLEKDGCPFCTEEPESQLETVDIEVDTDEDENDPDIADDGEYILANDSGVLAQALGSRPKWEVVLELPQLNSPPYVKADYFRARKTDSKGRPYLRSYVCPNAHHLIPGNASLGRAIQLLKWLADTVNFTRVRYKPLSSAPTAQMRSSLGKMRSVYTITTGSEGERITTERKRIFPKESSEARIRVTETKTISGRVSGKVDYDVNAATNGIWLPSNNAVNGWARLDSSMQDRYVQAAIDRSREGTKYRQFHDAHKDYSNNVRQALNDLAAEVEKLSSDCIADESHTAGNSEPLPAPSELLSSLNRMSSMLATQLRGKKKSWKHPWIASARSLTIS